jgi:hypothetical protein
MFGVHGERSDCTLEDYRELIGAECPLFSYDPELFVEQGEPKRARTSDSPTPSTEDADPLAFERCNSGV